MSEKVVILHGFTPDEALLVVRAVKGQVASAAEAAFATSTETNMDWKLSYLLDHVSEEHRQFREMRDKASKAQKS